MVPSIQAQKSISSQVLTCHRSASVQSIQSYVCGKQILVVVYAPSRWLYFLKLTPKNKRTHRGKLAFSHFAVSGDLDIQLTKQKYFCSFEYSLTNQAEKELMMHTFGILSRQNSISHPVSWVSSCSKSHHETAFYAVGGLHFLRCSRVTAPRSGSGLDPSQHLGMSPVLSQTGVTPFSQTHSPLTRAAASFFRLSTSPSHSSFPFAPSTTQFGGPPAAQPKCCADMIECSLWFPKFKLYLRN